MARVNINWIRIIQPSINPAGRPIDFKTIKIIGLAIRKEIIVFLYQFGAAPKKLLKIELIIIETPNL
tara:strand:- start:153 stop:353 length:201 start_codon:yes stop_codon:yes gene_type:complete